MPPSIERPRWQDMQGLILSAYTHLERAQYLLFTIRNEAAAREWLAELLRRDLITNALKVQEPDGSLRARDVNVNVALTAPGLATLCGLGGGRSVDELAHHFPGFSYPFLEGIRGRDHRSRILGNVGSSAPGRWRWGGTDPQAPPVHLLLMIYANGDEAALNDAVRQIEPPAGAMMHAGRLPATLPISEASQREHFGFADGISQPIVAGSTDAARFPDSVHVTALGEFVFGYTNQFGDVPTPPALRTRADFGVNGSYLVLLQFAQHVDAFWDYVASMTSVDGRPSRHAAEQLASKIVGRLPDGTPLVPCANARDNEFDYAEDPYGYGCPLGAHIRRSNPRDVTDPSQRNRHRILRRGRSYDPRARPGEEVKEERGLFFICLNADLERQFEFILQNWTNNPGFGGLDGECDPLIGAQPGCPTAKGAFTIPGLPAPARVSALPRFVEVKGAEYFFLPGLPALATLAEGERRANS